jgi:hypothetical protein
VWKLNETENFAVEIEIHDVSTNRFEVKQVCAKTCCSQEREEVNMESNRHEEHGTFGTWTGLCYTIGDFVQDS